MPHGLPTGQSINSVGVQTITEVSWQMTGNYSQATNNKMFDKQLVLDDVFSLLMLWKKNPLKGELR